MRRERVKIENWELPPIHARKMFVAFTVCPWCGGPGALRRGVHSVNDAGEVNPSFVCPNGCGFHAWVTLGGWFLGLDGGEP